jgi:hypothetical protein
MEPGSVFTEAHRAFLEEHGYVVITDVVPHNLCDAAFQDIMPHFKLWDESLTLENPDAWSGKNLPSGTIHGIARCFADTQGQWEIRQYHKVARAFADIYRVDSVFDMVTSRDALNFYHAERPISKSAKTFWCHVDVGSKVTGVGLDCVQGYVDLIGSEGPNDGTLIVWDKAHRIHEKFFDNPEVANSKEARGNWYRFSEEFMAELERDGSKYLWNDDPHYGRPEPLPMRMTRVHAPKGSLVLWYSRTPHMNRGPVPPANHRCVVYVCQAPKLYLTDKDKKNRAKAWEERRQTSHWPCFNQVKLFPVIPKLWSKEAEEEQKPKLLAIQEYFKSKTPDLTPLGKSLLCSDPVQETAKTPAKAKKTRLEKALGVNRKITKQTVIRVQREAK